MDQEEKKKVKQMKDRARKKAQRARDKENFDDWMRKRLVLNEREKTRYHKVRCSLDAEGQAEQKQKWKESKRKFRERFVYLSITKCIVQYKTGLFCETLVNAQQNFVIAGKLYCLAPTMLLLKW